MELLRRAHADLATINLVENALAERRPCMVMLDPMRRAVCRPPDPQGLDFYIPRALP